MGTNYALAALGVASAQDYTSSSSYCTFNLNVHNFDDITCEGDTIMEMAMTLPIGECVLDVDADDVWVYVPFCSMTYGIAYFGYQDAACTLPFTDSSSQLGCPNRGCCHFSSLDNLMDIDGDGTGDFAYVINFSVDVY